MKGRVKRSVSILLFAAACAALPGAELVERIVARVNDGLITQSDFDKRLALFLKAAPKTGSIDQDEAKRSVLEDLIKEKLLEDRAREMSVSATQDEIDAAVERVKSQYGLASDADFDAALAQSGMTRADLRHQLEQTITLQKVIGREVTSRLDQSDDALRAEYERRKETLYVVPASAHVYEVLLRFSANDAESRQQAVQKVEEIQGKLKSGTPFADLAKQYSSGSARDRGGDIGSVSKGELVEALNAAIFAEPAAEYPAPVITSDSIHLYRVTDRRAAGFKSFAEIKEDLRKRNADELYERRFAEYMDKLRREAFVKIYDPALAKLDEKKASS